VPTRCKSVRSTTADIIFLLVRLMLDTARRVDGLSGTHVFARCFPPCTNQHRSPSTRSPPASLRHTKPIRYTHRAIYPVKCKIRRGFSRNKPIHTLAADLMSLLVLSLGTRRWSLMWRLESERGDEIYGGFVRAARGWPDKVGGVMMTGTQREKQLARRWLGDAGYCRPRRRSAAATATTILVA
jgi:hypothetical protein